MFVLLMEIMPINKTNRNYDAGTKLNLYNLACMRGYNEKRGIGLAINSNPLFTAITAS